ncbi:MAG: hypothetical protein IJA20_02470 [Methanocorpusculum sp.]|nr:hypothetical protein [Oscillospiraceae bacterium]MBQ3569518.1 hypothetical protein [Methanocorpusculum sp.]
MSYTIEYNRQFLRSERGITPVWLSGSNNVWEPRPYGRERRCREWNCFMNLLGAPEAEIMEAVQNMCGGPYQEHWKSNGRWVDDAGLIRWAKNGIRDACTVEELLSRNWWSSLSAYLHIWSRDLKDSIELHSRIDGTAALDAFIDKARARIGSKATGESIYPHIVFPEEQFHKPHAVERSAPRGGDTALQITSGEHTGAYIHKITRHSYWYSKNPKDARLYCGVNAAKLAAERLMKRHETLNLVPVVLKAPGTV